MSAMEKKKRIIGILAVLLAIVFCMTGLAEEKNTGSVPVAIKVTSAYGGLGKVGCSIPLTVELYGQSDARFSGTFHVSSLESGNDGKEERYDYSWNVQVNPAETKKMEINVPLGQKSGRLYFTLKDQAGKTMGEASMDFDISREAGGFLVGVLSNDTKSLDYLDAVSLNYGMVQSRLLPLKAEQIPEDARGLDMLDMIIINRFESKTLTEAQREAILSWVKEGGILLFGTGRGGTDSLYGFKEDFVNLPMGRPEYKSVNMGAEYAASMPQDAEIGMYWRELDIPSGEACVSGDEMTLLTMVKRGQGEVGIFSIDPADLKEFAEKNPTYKTQMMSQILGEKRLYNLYYYSSYGADSDYWNAQSLVSGGNADRLPNLPLYGAVMAVYIVFAGPGLYILLKRKELSRYYSMAAVFLSAAACGVVYLMGGQTRFTSAFSTSATILDMNGESVEELTYLNIRTPDGRGFSVKLAPDYQVSPLTRSSRYDEVPLMEFERKKTANMGLRFEEDGTVLWSRKTRAFDSRYFCLNRTRQVEDGQNIESDLEIFDGKVTGYVKNGLSVPLEDAALFRYGQVLPLGRLEAGETREFFGEPLLTWPVGLPWILAETLTEGADKEKDTDSEYLENMEKTSLYSFFANRYYGTYNSEVRLGALGPSGGFAGNVSFGEEQDGMVFYTAVLETSNTRDGLQYVSGQMREPKTASGNGSNYGNSTVMYGTEPLVVEYSFGKGMDVEKLSFLPASDVFFNDRKYAYLKQFSGQAYFYNRMTNTYDSVNLEQVDFFGSELLSYLSPDGKLTVKYAGGEGTDMGISQVLPLLMVTGRER